MPPSDIYSTSESEDTELIFDDYSETEAEVEKKDFALENKHPPTLAPSIIAPSIASSAGSAKTAKTYQSRDNFTTATNETEREYANFPSRDVEERELRSIRRQAEVPLAVKPWCVRDVAWLDTKLSKHANDSEFARPAQVNYTPFPHLPSQEGMLAVSLGIVDMRPGEPHWEGPTNSEFRKLDAWFLAGAQHILRSRSSAQPYFFLRFPEVEIFEARCVSILESLPRQIYQKQSFGIAKSMLNSVLAALSPLRDVESLQERLQSDKREYLERCLMICYNLKRLRFWLWREYNREYQRLMFGVQMLSRAMHETLHKSGRLGDESVIGSLERLKTSMDPIVPLYQRNNNLTRAELMEAAEKELLMNPLRTWDHEALSNLARKAFARNKTDFTSWSDEELKSYAHPDDDLWRAIEMGHVQQKAADLTHDAQLPVYYKPRNLNEPQDTEFHLPIFLRSMDLEYIVKKRWIRLMKMTKKVPTNYISQTDHFVFPPVQPSTLESIWTKITAHKGYYIYKIPRPLRRTSSMPDLQQGFRRRRRLNDDQDTTNLGFGLDDLPARLPPRLHHGKPPTYPLEKDHPLCPLKNGLINHSFIVIGWFPGKLMEPVEVCMWYTKPEKFLNDLRHQINQLRGWRRYISLKTVQGFGLYQCMLKDRSHAFVPSSASENAILAQFHTACFERSLSMNKNESKEWSRWVTSELNNWQGGNTFYFPIPTESHLSLRLMTRWSRYRLVLASTIPMILSLAIGFYYMTVSDDIQTAWTVSSYIITAGAFLIAVLAVLTTLQDGGNDLGQAKKRGADAGIGV